jgi:hypothetical protein
MFASTMVITLTFSFCLQIYVIIQYLATKSSLYYKTFLGTFIINTILMVIISTIALRHPESIYMVNSRLVLWLLSGFISIFILILKITTIIKIVKRTKDPANYTINFFGKKVYEAGIIKKYEFAMFVLTMPIFLFVGAYFVARLVNIIIYGHI